MGIPHGFLRCFKKQGVSIASQKLVLAFVLVVQLSLVSCVPEDYYNSDYDEEAAAAATGPMMGTGNWGDFLQDPAADEHAGDVIKKHMGSLAAKASRPASAIIGSRNLRSDVGVGVGADANKFNSEKITRTYYPFWRVPSARVGHPGRVIKNRSGDDGDYTQGAPAVHFEDGASTMDSMKKKRFLGSMARGGWFPREFRGSIDAHGQQWDKRHLGAAAKIGWLKQFKPTNKNTKRFEDFQNGRFSSFES